MGNSLKLKDAIYQGWLQTQSSAKYYAILHGTMLHIFESDVLVEQKPVKTLNLIKYDKIKPIRFKETEFKYGFRLKDKTKNRIMYGCKTKNECHEWITHIDYIVNHKIAALPDSKSKESNKKDQIKNVYNILLEDYDDKNKKYIKTVFTNDTKKSSEKNGKNGTNHIHKEPPCDSIQDCKHLVRLLLVDKMYRKWCQCYHKVEYFKYFLLCQ